MRLLAAFVVPLLLLAGCSSTPAEDPQDAAPIVVTRPDDFANSTLPGAHIHDYWGGKDRLTVVELTHPGGDEPGTGPGFAMGSDVEVRSFEPESGHVVPQGTAAVEVTVTWTDAQMDAYADPALWMKHAGQNATERVASLTNGQPVTLETGAAAADLPHQLLSAWVFELRMANPEPMPLRFKGSVTLKVDALRGLPLPIYPPHPDHWAGATELPLLQASGQLAYFQDLGDGGCNGAYCPEVFRPESGRVVPTDAYLVRVTLSTPDPQELELHYHSGLEREFMPVEPVRMDGAARVYEILVEGGGDGPYATQSQWEFTVLPAMVGPVRTAWMADYSFEAVAVR